MTSSVAFQARSSAQAALVAIGTLRVELHQLLAQHVQLREDFETLKKQVAKDQKVLESLRRWKDRIRNGIRDFPRHTVPGR